MRCNFRQLVLIVVFANFQAKSATIREDGDSRRRMKRQQCQYGLGDFKEQQCCRCPPGYHAGGCSENDEKHCRSCDVGSYLDHANLLDSCEPCTSCDPKANLETEKNCSVTQNTVCRCMEGSYCDREECKSCHSCKKCEDGFVIEKECTTTMDTVCKKAEEGGPWWIVFIVITVLVIAGIVWFLKKQKKFCFADKPKTEDPEMDKVNRINELTPLKGIYLVPHLYDIAEILGPQLTKDLARGALSEAQIQFHEEDTRNNARERSYRILNDWCELQGLEEAAPNLIKRLIEIGKKTSADQIKEILAEKTDTIRE